MLIGATVKASDLVKIRCQDPRCTNPDCTDVILKTRCHPKAGVTVTVNKHEGALTIACMQCEKHVVHIKVNE